ncbi:MULTISPECIES: glycosyltransferase family A protein [unclassified Haloarcula]|uniref:glycosyltransferase family 2 protein n=1 Tax=unclassified Haloarcula TaxID=2624677 RepID=UPI000EF142BD|nr:MULTISPECIES: glycosyltransferase family A protein [unclassified Haloarcula]RLM34463.1 glycosyltransferase family 2 protein [Haloarcula sp. Atlit-120R]RLM95218.1 glycosyltransferase family 2 protein [Haloarcula sp. Atlit-7R]
MNDPLVSVVLPTYDRPENLRNAVQSVQEQTYSHIELVVVDDHSPTPAADTLSPLSFDELTVEIIRHEENRGANEARNTGIRESTGEYIAFLDDDDDWAPSKIEKQVAAFREAGPEVGVVYTGSEYVYDDYVRTVTFSLEGDVTEEMLRGRSLGEFTTLMVRRDVVRAAGLPDTDFPSWQDRDWLLRLSRHCEFKTVPEALTTRRRKTGEDSISDNFEEKRDISYPLFIEKHRDLAAEYGWRCERAFMAATTESLGQEALKNGYYADAKKYLLKALRYHPLDRSRLVYALVAYGGKYTYRAAHTLASLLHRVRTDTIHK